MAEEGTEKNRQVEHSTHPALSLRQQAEAIARAKAATPSVTASAAAPLSTGPLSAEEAQRTLHELRVHQIELELQNEELRRAQWELELERARYFELYDLAPVGYLTISQQGLILESNFAAATLLETPRGAVARQMFSWFILPEDQDTYYRFRKKLLATGQSQSCELRMVRKEGETFRALLTASTAPSTGGETVCHLVLVDVTEHARDEEKVRASEDRFRKLFEGHSAIKLILDPDTGKILDANQAAADFYGWSIAELKQQHIQQINTLGPEALAFKLQQIKAGKSTRFEFRHRRADGSIRDVEVYSNRVEIAGKVELYSVIHDITDRKSAQEALRKSQGELDAIFENAPVAMMLVDGDGMVRRANRAANQLADSNLVELVGQRGGDALRCVSALNNAGGCGLGPDCQNCTIRRTVLDTFATGRAHTQVEKTLRVSRGEGTVEIALLVSTTLMVTGEQRLVLLCAEDMTERMRLEAQLLQAQKMEAIGRLAGGIAHDFRNQLTVVKGYSEMLLRMSLIKDGQEGFVGEILKATHRGSQLTGQLLAFSRKDMLQPAIVNLGKVVADLAGPMGRLVGEDIVTTVSGGSGAGEELMVDLAATQFEHAMMNLAANARDAMPQGGKLTLDTAGVVVDEAMAARMPDAHVGPYVRVTVRDSGAGMDEATQSRLFEPFFTTKERGKGTGLGLPMVYGFVRQSGGFVTVESAPGKGTSFALHFPRIVAAVQPDAPGAGAAAPRPGGSAPRGTETILVVEDEEPIRWLLIHSLREQGYTVIESSDARQAVDAADKLEVAGAEGGARIDLLITDVIMPGMSGVELAAQVRQRWPGIPVLFISGYGTEDLTERGVDLARAEIIAKPFDHAHLVKTVRRMLEATAAV